MSLRLVITMHAAPGKGTELAKLQALPRDGRPISEWPNQDKAYVDVVEGVARAVDDLLSGRPPLRGD